MVGGRSSSALLAFLAKRRTRISRWSSQKTRAGASRHAVLSHPPIAVDSRLDRKEVCLTRHQASKDASASRLLSRSIGARAVRPGGPFSAMTTLPLAAIWRLAVREERVGESPASTALARGSISHDPARDLRSVISRVLSRTVRRREAAIASHRKAAGPFRSWCRFVAYDPSHRVHDFLRCSPAKPSNPRLIV